MKASTLFNKFCKENKNIATIAKMVVNQLGGVDGDTLRELYEIRNASDGYTGFIYYNQTSAFWAKVRRYAMPFMEEEAWSLGESCVLAMVKNFNCLRGDYTESEIAVSLYGNLRNSNEYIDNALAWFCLEETAYFFHEWVYDSEYNLDEITD